MADRIIYPQKILTDQDLSQNDIRNVRNISNDGHSIKVESNKGVGIDSPNIILEGDSSNLLSNITTISGNNLDVLSSTTKVGVTREIDEKTGEETEKVLATFDKNSSSTKISGDKLDIDASTTNISGDNLNLSSKDINLDNSDVNNSTLKIKGKNDLEITSDYSYDTQDASKKSSLVSSNYVEVKKELFSDNIRVYWDTDTNSLVFEKK